MELSNEIITQTLTLGEQLAQQLGPQTLKLGHGLADLTSHLPPLPPEIQPYVEWVESLLSGNLGLLHTGDGYVILAGVGTVALGCVALGLRSLATHRYGPSNSFQLTPNAIPGQLESPIGKTIAETSAREDQVDRMIGNFVKSVQESKRHR